MSGGRGAWPTMNGGSRRICYGDYFWRMAGGDPWRPSPVGYPQSAGGPLPSDELPPGYDLRDLTAAYYAATTCADDLVGRLPCKISKPGAWRTIPWSSLRRTTAIISGSHHLFFQQGLPFRGVPAHSVDLPFSLPVCRKSRSDPGGATHRSSPDAAGRGRSRGRGPRPGTQSAPPPAGRTGKAR